LTTKGWLGVLRHDSFTPIFNPVKVTIECLNWIFI
jgi:hypothetical protein